MDYYSYFTPDMQERPELYEKTRFIQKNGVTLECTASGGQTCVRRLVCTDPKAYLNANYSPGSKI